MFTNTAAKQVLVVEDNPGDCLLIQETFGKLSNVLWHFVPNVIKARDFLQRREPYQLSPRPDVVLLDLHFPIYSGFSLIPAIRANPELRSIKIVVFTSSQSEKDRTLCTEMGADEFIVKPIDLHEWSDALINAIRL
jgi:CheY-like chemotaxis protein